MLVWRGRVCLAGELALERGTTLGATVPPEGDEEDVEGDADGEDACADFRSSSLAFCSDTEAAPRAFSMSRVSPATPGAEPWWVALGAAGLGAGVLTDAAGGELLLLELECPRRATNHTAAAKTIAPSAI
jgi:hypothetical protein